MGKKKWEVVKATKAPIVGIGVNGKMRKFGKDCGAFTLSDPGEARDVEQMYGSHSKTGNGAVVVCEVPDERYTGKSFRMPELPWKRDKE